MRRRSSDVGLLVVIVLAGVLALVQTQDQFFSEDDWFNFAIADTEPFGRFLTIDYFGTLAPGHRLIDLLVVETGPSWTLYRLFMLPIWVLGVLGMRGLWRETVGRGRGEWIAVVLFAFSPVWVRTFGWLASGAHVIPGACFAVASLWLTVRHWRTGSRVHLVLASLTLIGGLACYSKPLLVPVYAVILRALLVPVPADGRIPALRDIPKRLLSAWPTWVALGLPAVILFAAMRVKGLGNAIGDPTLEQWSQLFRATWNRGVWPLSLGQHVWLVDRTTVWNDLAIVGGQIVFVGAFVLSLLRSPHAWRAWLFLAVAFAGSTVLIGLTRLTGFGPLIALDPRYNAEYAFLLPITIGLAFSVPRAAGTAGAGRLTAARTRLDALWARVATPQVLTVATALVVVGLVASSIGGGRGVNDRSSGYTAREWLVNVKQNLAALRERGQEPSLLDTAAPGRVGSSLLSLSAHVSYPLAKLKTGARTDVAGGPHYYLDEAGTMNPAVVDEAFAGRAKDLQRRGALVWSGVQPTVRGDAVCATAPANGRPASVDVAPAGKLGEQDNIGVQLLVERAAGDTPEQHTNLFVDRSSGYPAVPDRTLDFRRGKTTAVRTLGGPLVAKVGIGLPAGREFCLTRIAFLRWKPQPGGAPVVPGVDIRAPGYDGPRS